MDKETKRHDNIINKIERAKNKKELPSISNSNILDELVKILEFNGKKIERIKLKNISKLLDEGYSFKSEIIKRNIVIIIYNNFENIKEEDITNKYIEIINNIKINNILYELRIKGIIPIIAHPERYDYVEKNPNIVKEWIEEGAILQSNYGSIIGIYGSGPQKTIKKLLKKNLIDVLASDVHYPNNKIYQNMDKIEKKLKRITKDYEKLVYTNPKLIIENKEISRNY